MRGYLSVFPRLAFAVKKLSRRVAVCSPQAIRIGHKGPCLGLRSPRWGRLRAGERLGFFVCSSLKQWRRCCREPRLCTQIRSVVRSSRRECKHHQRHLTRNDSYLKCPCATPLVHILVRPEWDRTTTRIESRSSRAPAAPLEPACNQRTLAVSRRNIVCSVTKQTRCRTLAGAGILSHARGRIVQGDRRQVVPCRLSPRRLEFASVWSAISVTCEFRAIPSFVSPLCLSVDLTSMAVTLHPQSISFQPCASFMRQL